MDTGGGWYSRGHQMMTQQLPKGPEGCWRSEIVIVKPTHNSLKRAESSLAGPHKGGQSWKIGDGTREAIIG